MTLFSQYLRDVAIPVFVYRKGSGIVKSKLEIFKLFPVLLTILSMWGLCAILTSIALTIDPSNQYRNETFGNETSWSDTWLNNTKARTDTNLPLLEKSLWFRFPYPCKNMRVYKSGIKLILLKSKSHIYNHLLYISSMGNPNCQCCRSIWDVCWSIS